LAQASEFSSFFPPKPQKMIAPAHPSVSEDERFARELQQAELGQAAVPPTVHGIHLDAHPVVQGVAVPVFGRAPFHTVNRTLGAMPPPVVVVTPLVPPEELVVLNYRLAVMCFALVDAVRFLTNAVLMATRLDAPHEIFDARSKEFKILGFIWLALILGPICGYVGAKRLNRGLVFVYIFFCFLELGGAIFRLIVFPSFVWLILGVVFQAWITKLVVTFFVALGVVPPSRRAELLIEKDTPAHMVYW